MSMAGPQGVSGGFADAFERLSLAARNALKVSTTRATIGTTPRQAIWTLNKATLYRYTPKLPPEERHPVPLVLVFALMNKAAILDLRPGNSFVEHMLGRGYDVYLMDWGTPGPEDSDLGLEDYVLEYLPRALRKSGISEARSSPGIWPPLRFPTSICPGSPAPSPLPTSIRTSTRPLSRSPTS